MSAYEKIWKTIWNADKKAIMFTIIPCFVIFYATVFYFLYMCEPGSIYWPTERIFIAYYVFAVGDIYFTGYFIWLGILRTIKQALYGCETCHHTCHWINPARLLKTGSCEYSVIVPSGECYCKHYSAEHTAAGCTGQVYKSVPTTVPYVEIAKRGTGRFEDVAYIDKVIDKYVDEKYMDQEICGYKNVPYMKEVDASYTIKEYASVPVTRSVTKTRPAFRNETVYGMKTVQVPVTRTAPSYGMNTAPSSYTVYEYRSVPDTHIKTVQYTETYTDTETTYEMKVIDKLVACTKTVPDVRKEPIYKPVEKVRQVPVYKNVTKTRKQEVMESYSIQKTKIVDVKKLAPCECKHSSPQKYCGCNVCSCIACECERNDWRSNSRALCITTWLCTVACIICETMFGRY